VAEVLGTPSTISAFGDPTWYYVSYRTETVAFFSPKEVERTVLAIDFDERGTVKGVRTLGLEDGQAVSFAERETPTAGKELNLLQQFLGNVGRFSNDGPGEGRIGGSSLPY
jgi:outer membrane protein assembly factor BamE (lipoprotein component of BamABCDE complex)